MNGTKREKLHNTPRTSQNKGITLVALIITIIVLLILAVVAIRAVSNDGIISHAKNARAEYEKAQAEEQAMLESYLGTIEADKVATTMEEAQKNIMLSKTKNSEITDRYGNKIVVPAGFKILVDGTTDYKAEDIDVTKGIVIQDSNGNEFVWIPVGDVYTTEDTEKTESNTTKIELKRYVFADGNTTYEEGKLAKGTIVNSLTQTEPGGQLEGASSDNYYYTEGLKNSKTNNAHAKDIIAFKTSAINNHGYYIGRYEAGVSGYDADNITTSNSNKEENWTGYVAAEGKELQLVCKSNQQVWNYITQKKASELCKSMYTNKPYESDLINSYAWDTAIVFIQTFGANGVGEKEPNSSTYSRENKSTGFRNTGLNPDKYRNIYDMSGNVCEWSTETYSISGNPCTKRGGYYWTYYGFASDYTSNRSGGRTDGGSSHSSFRPLLYV